MNKRISFFAAVAIMFITSSVLAQEVISLKANKKNFITESKKDITIGFKTGGQAFLAPVIYKAKPAFSTINKVFVKKNITDHIAIETGVGFYRNPINLNQTTATDNLAIKSRTCTISIPASVQYYLLPQKKIHPYIGVGGVYNISTQQNMPPQTDGQKCCLVNGTKYVSLLVTQGIIYEVNTKIQISESVHFMPNNNENVIGIDLGIGYKL